MNIRPKLIVNTYTDNEISTVSFEIYNETLPEEIIKTIKLPGIVKELKEIIGSEDKPYPMDYMVDIFYTHTNPHTAHKHFEEYWNYVKTVNSTYDSESKTYHYDSFTVFSRPVILYPVSKITINDTDIKIFYHNHNEAITDELINNVIRPEIIKELKSRRQYQENQNLEYIADVFLDDNKNYPIPIRKVINDGYKAKNMDWTDATLITIEKVAGNPDVKIFVHERIKNSHNS